MKTSERLNFHTSSLSTVLLRVLLDPALSLSYRRHESSLLYPSSDALGEDSFRRCFGEEILPPRSSLDYMEVSVRVSPPELVIGLRDG